MKINKILISQPAPSSPEKSPFAEVVSKHKVVTQFTPFIKIEGVSAKEFRSQRIDVIAHSAVIFTSRTTIDNFFTICEQCRITIPETMKYFCTTEAIALYLQKYIVYRKRKIFFGKSSFSDLVELIVKHNEENFLLALSEPHKPEIPELLDKAKIKYEKVILSRTVSTKIADEIDITNYDMLVFYSPYEIASLIENFRDKVDEKTKIAAFGVGTAKMLISNGLSVTVLAPTKESPSMAMALDKYISQIEEGKEVDTTYILESIKEANILSDRLMAKVKTTKSKRPTTKTTAKGTAKAVKKETKKVTVVVTNR